MDAEVDALPLPGVDAENLLDLLGGLREGFAGLLWHPLRNRLLMFRDPLGRRPLFYAPTPDGHAIAFSSLMGPLLQYPELPRRPNVNTLEAMAVFGFPVHPRATVFDSIEQVTPGAVIQFSGVTPQVMGTLSVRPLRANGSAAETLHKALTKAVRNAVHEEGPCAVFLSGGLDSTLLAATAARLAVTRTTAYTLVDQSPAPSNFEDAEAARRVAAELGSQQVEVPFEASSWLELLPDAVLSNEMYWPASVFDPGGDVGFFALGQAAAESQALPGCVLAGEGADELFGGYWMHRFPLGFKDRLRDRARLVGPSAVQQLDQWLPSSQDRVSAQAGIYRLLLGPGLYNYHCWCADRTARWWRLPLYTPYLDDEMVAVALAVPLSEHLKGDTGKTMLRALVSGLLTPSTANLVVSRRKSALPAATAGAYRRMQAMLAQLVPPGRWDTHPYRRFLTSLFDTLCFDLWYALFVSFAARKPEGLTAFTLYSDWRQALPQEGPDQ